MPNRLGLLIRCPLSSADETLILSAGASAYGGVLLRVGGVDQAQTALYRRAPLFRQPVQVIDQLVNLQL